MNLIHSDTHEILEVYKFDKRTDEQRVILLDACQRYDSYQIVQQKHFTGLDQASYSNILYLYAKKTKMAFRTEGIYNSKNLYRINILIDLAMRVVDANQRACKLAMGLYPEFGAAVVPDQEEHDDIVDSDDDNIDSDATEEAADLETYESYKLFGQGGRFRRRLRQNHLTALAIVDLFCGSAFIRRVWFE